MTGSWMQRVLETVRPRGGRYTLLTDDTSSSEQQKSLRYRRLARIAIFIVPIWLILLFINYHHPLRRPATQTQSSGPEASFVHFLLSATAGTTSFCRTLYSAGALNYPTPRIINWDATFKDRHRPDKGESLGKIDAVLDFLKKLDGAHDDELVLIADGYDTWFQLRPEVLLERYHAINERARQRIWPRYGLKYYQSIVFSAQRHCEDADDDSCACSLAPPSPLSDSVYGDLTDQPTDDIMNQHVYMRPRYLNTGMTIGPAGKVRNLYEYAHQKMEDNATHYITDRQVFSEIFGEQEYFREMVMANSSRVPEGELANDPRNGHISGDKIELDCDQCQFEIGLDYLGELSMPTIYSEAHIVQINPNSTSTLKLPEDIRTSTPPYWTPDYSGTRPPLPFTPWSDLPLRTDRSTHTIPAAIHYHREAPTNDTASAWSKQWYHSDLRPLLDGHAKSFRMPFAVLHDQPKIGVTHEYWGPLDGYGGVRIHHEGDLGGEWRQWDELCGSDEIGREVFGDGKDRYENPVYFLYWDAEKQNSQLDRWIERVEGERTAGVL
ncbi:uncharacterized protein AB675_37 [Cyphellophora attinorum]|uniref:Uncharacterized protein n=1 Tax=Cyphellophora attinorum TaxID=1664694 RepID=A0A0N1GXB2_9EURO|nr:uncharacterized protein AB675_37 [Phialophora attinorum]KPI34770.1 hypothetical protein AB675_37 [Phialophora attinorum]